MNTQPGSDWKVTASGVFVPPDATPKDVFPVKVLGFAPPPPPKEPDVVRINTKDGADYM